MCFQFQIFDPDIVVSLKLTKGLPWEEQVYYALPS